jgi:hypothetical protein
MLMTTFELARNRDSESIVYVWIFVRVVFLYIYSHHDSLGYSMLYLTQEQNIL